MTLISVLPHSTATHPVGPLVRSQAFAGARCSGTGGSGPGIFGLAPTRSANRRCRCRVVTPARARAIVHDAHASRASHEIGDGVGDEADRAPRVRVDRAACALTIATRVSSSWRRRQVVPRAPTPWNPHRSASSTARSLMVPIACDKNQCAHPGRNRTPIVSARPDRRHGQRRRQHSDDEAGRLGCEEAVRETARNRSPKWHTRLHAAVGQDALLSPCLAALCRGGAEKPDALDQRIERRRATCTSR